MGSIPKTHPLISSLSQLESVDSWNSYTWIQRRFRELVEVRVRSVEEAKASDVKWCDGLAVGSPTNMGVLSWKMKRFWDEEMIDSWMKVDGKIAVPLAVREGGVAVWSWRANRFTRC